MNTKITKYYIDHAVYNAEDCLGNKYKLEVDYWNNKFKVSSKNVELESFATSLLAKKHRANLWPK